MPIRCTLDESDADPLFLVDPWLTLTFWLVCTSRNLPFLWLCVDQIATLCFPFRVWIEKFVCAFWMVVLFVFRFSQSTTKSLSLSLPPHHPSVWFLSAPVQSNDGTIRRKLSNPRSNLDGVRRDHDVYVNIGRWSTATRHATWPRQKSNY